MEDILCDTCDSRGQCGDEERSYCTGYHGPMGEVECGVFYTWREMEVIDAAAEREGEIDY